MLTIPKLTGQKSLGEHLLTIAVVVIGIVGLIILAKSGPTLAVFHIIAYSLPIYGPWVIVRTAEPNRRYLFLAWIIGAGCGLFFFSSFINGVKIAFVFIGVTASIFTAIFQIFQYTGLNAYFSNRGAIAGAVIGIGTTLFFLNINGILQKEGPALLFIQFIFWGFAGSILGWILSKLLALIKGKSVTKEQSSSTSTSRQFSSRDDGFRSDFASSAVRHNLSSNDNN